MTYNQSFDKNNKDKQCQKYEIKLNYDCQNYEIKKIITITTKSKLTKTNKMNLKSSQ